MKKFIFILSLIAFSSLDAGFFDLFSNPQNKSDRSNDPGFFEMMFTPPKNPTPQNRPVFTNTPGTTNSNPQSSNIKQSIDIALDSMTLKEIKTLLSEILAEIKKGHFNIFNVNLQNGNAISSVINSENFNNLNNKNTNYINQYLFNIKNQAKKDFDSITNWLKNNKKKTFFIALTSFYAALNLKLISLIYHLSKQSNWSNWQPEKTLEDFYRVPQTIFATDLLKAIQNFYMGLNNVTDYVTPISKFVIDIHTEINNINMYVKIINILQKFRVNKVFIYSNKIYLQANDRLNRLLFIKNIFLSWLADHKLNQFKVLKKLDYNIKKINI